MAYRMIQVGTGGWGRMWCETFLPPNIREGLIEQPKWANTWLIDKFVRWLDGGEPMETNVEANLQSVAMVFAAIASSWTGRPVRVQDFLEGTRAGVRA